MNRLQFIASVFLIVVPVSVAQADDFFCPPNITGVIPGNVVVPPGQTCVVSAATVRGNVVALVDARLFVTSNTTVEGNVEGKKASAVQVVDSTVHGNIFIEEAHDPFFASALVLRSRVVNGNVHILKGTGEDQGLALGDWTVFQTTVLNGNIIAEDNVASFSSRVAQSPLVKGNVQIYKNKGPGLKFVRFNTILEDLQCFENDPPFVGFPNAARKAEGQCGLTTAPSASLAESEGAPQPNADGLYEKTRE